MMSLVTVLEYLEGIEGITRIRCVSGFNLVVKISAMLLIFGFPDDTKFQVGDK
jgi:hypothetical protein